MARKLGVHNLRFLQGDILDVKRLDQQFHVIQCVGVLHHMADPMQGWQTLAHRLVPGGVMKIGLYSELARAAVISARERIKALGLGSSPTDIKAFRHEILQNDGSADLAELTRSEDFYNLSACRDLLFHVNEHRFTVPQIREALADLGLTFIGFELPTAQTRALYLQEYPADPGLRDFSAWDRFEERHPRSFAGMYRFWCQKPLVVL